MSDHDESHIQTLSDGFGGLIPENTDVREESRPSQWKEDGYTVIRGHAPWQKGSSKKQQIVVINETWVTV